MAVLENWASCWIRFLLGSQVAEAKRSHLAGMAAKLAYEDPILIRDAVTRWGFTWLADQKVTTATNAKMPETWNISYGRYKIKQCLQVQAGRRLPACIAGDAPSVSCPMLTQS